MTLLFSEGFYPYAAQADLANYGITVNGYILTYQATGGYNSQPAFQIGSTGNTPQGAFCIDYANPFSAPASNEIRFGFWMKTVTAGSITSSYQRGSFWLANSTQTYCLNVRLNMTTSPGRIAINNLVAFNSSIGDYTYVGTTDLRDGQHHWIEVRAIIAAASGGTFQVWVDGTLEINQTGITNDGGSGLTATALTRLGLANWTSQNSVTSHIMIWDTSGSGMTGYIGPSRIETITPNGAQTSQLSPTAGANYTNVNETVPNFDTNYVEGVAAGLIDLYDYTTLSVTPAAIKGVMVKTFAKNADVGSKTFRAKCSSNSVVGNGVTQTLTVAYKQFTEFFPTDPNTAAAWTKAGIDSAQFGVEVQT